MIPGTQAQMHSPVYRYNQHFVDKLPVDKTAVNFLRDLHTDLIYQDARRMLGRYGLEGHAHEIPMRDLSGGQKARVQFLNVALAQPHILFLGEMLALATLFSSFHTPASQMSQLTIWILNRLMPWPR